MEQGKSVKYIKCVSFIFIKRINVTMQRCKINLRK